MPYVESPLDRIVNVNWRRGIGGSVSVAFTAVPQPPDHFVYAPGGITTMTVEVSGVPPLSRSTLTISAGAGGSPGTPSDEVSGGDFPDGNGQMFGTYDLSYGAAAYIVGGVNYQTSATRDWFGGADSVSIHVTVNLQPLDPGTGYSWHASVIAGAGSFELSGANIPDTPTANVLSFTAVVGVTTPPNVSISPD